ncbi:MAG: hypothetical protein V1775_03870 [Bacteroidota bacterium]
MVRFVILFFLFISTFLSSAQQVSLNLARETYFGMNVDECNAFKLSTYFDKYPPVDAVMKAYYGASTAAAPVCISSPAKKIAYFRKGKQLIAEAVTLQPENFEIRFLRFATQSKTPAFLGYNQHIEDDKRFLLANMENGRNAVSNGRIFAKISHFLANSDRLTKSEQASVRRIIETPEK